MKALADNWASVQERIAGAAARCGRDPASIDVVAAAKSRTPAEIDAIVALGVACVGENRVDEAARKKPEVRARASWHFIGRLQTNKAGRAVELFDVVQSVDRERLALALEQRAAQAGRVLDVLVQVNSSGASQQGGVPVDAAEGLVARILALPHLRLRGLMSIGLFSPDERAVRACYAAVRDLRDRLRATFGAALELPCLSMGMSGDFEWAIAEGATMVRLGTALFGPRP